MVDHHSYTHNSSTLLDSSVGRALHLYRSGHGLESPSGLNFQALISQQLKLCVVFYVCMLQYVAVCCSMLQYVAVCLYV